MAGSGTRDEQMVRDVIKNDGEFICNGEEYRLIFCAKPVVPSGEPKTDTFVRTVNKKTNEQKDFKISTKKTDFAYLENHPKEKKLCEFFGSECKEIMLKMQRDVFKKFPGISPVIFEGEGKEKGITLGWRNEYLQESTRPLGIRLAQDVANKVWWGEGSPKEYLDAKVNGKIIPNSGMPDWILVKDAKDIKTSSDIFSNLKDIREFAKTHNDIDSTYQAHNYKMHRKKTCECEKKYRYGFGACPHCGSRKWKTVRCLECGAEIKLDKTSCPECKKAGKNVKNEKYESWRPHEGDSRELAVWFKFEAVNGKLSYKLVLDEPFKKAGEVRKNLQKCLKEIGAPDDQNFNISKLKGKIASNS